MGRPRGDAHPPPPGADRANDITEEEDARKEAVRLATGNMRLQHDLHDKTRLLTHYFGKLRRRDEMRAAAVRAGTLAANDGADLDGDGDSDGEENEISTARQGVHEIAEECAGVLGYHGRVLRGWAAEYRVTGTLSLDGRGRWTRAHLLDEEDILKKVRAFMLDKAAVHGNGETALSVDLMHEWLNKELLPELSRVGGAR